MGGLTPAFGRPGPLPVARPQALLVGVLLVLAALAWWDTDRRMAGMAGGPGADLGGVAFFTGVWIVMMAAMMFPSLVPTVVVYDRLRAAAERRSATAPGGEATALFAAGYLVTWAAAGLAAYAAIELARALDGGALAFDRAGRELTAAVVLVAAAYQLTPAKHRCLAACRGPLMFLLEHWHDGRRGALRMGAAHGAFCVGCCWALMATLFALGVMSLGWMAFVAALVVVEKLLPRRAGRGVVVVLVVLGLLVLLAPEAVPGLLGDPKAPMTM